MSMTGEEVARLEQGHHDRIHRVRSISLAIRNIGYISAWDGCVVTFVFLPLMA